MKNSYRPLIGEVEGEKQTPKSRSWPEGSRSFPGRTSLTREESPETIGGDGSELDEESVDPSRAATPPIDGSPSHPSTPSGTGRSRDSKVIKGKIYFIDDDELLLDVDPRGETKIDKDGNLLGGEFSVWRCLAQFLISTAA